jgi:lysophospholipase L1-like esterase
MSRLWIYGGLLLGAGIGVARLVTRGPSVRPGSRLLLIGDSLARGLAPPLGALAKDHKVVFESRGITGSRLDAWAKSAKLAEVIARFRPTTILVSLGTNDEYLRGDGGKRQRPYASQLWTQLDATGADVGWVGPPTLPKPTNGVTPMLRDVVPGPSYFASDELAIPRGGDGIHPTPRGYAGWAAALWRWLA